MPGPLFAGVAGDGSSDLQWVERPEAWHQQAVRIVDHQFTTFAELKTFATTARKAGVSVVRSQQSSPQPPLRWLKIADTAGHRLRAPATETMPSSTLARCGSSRLNLMLTRAY